MPSGRAGHFWSAEDGELGCGRVVNLSMGYVIVRGEAASPKDWLFIQVLSFQAKNPMSEARTGSYPRSSSYQSLYIVRRNLTSCPFL
jgi:hypothetical protein